MAQPRAADRLLIPPGLLVLALLLSGSALLNWEVAARSHESAELGSSLENARHQIEILQFILSSLADGVIVADENGRSLNWNPAAEQMGAVDVALDQLTERSDFRLPENGPPYPAYQAVLARAVRGETSRKVEGFVRSQARPAGLWVRTSGAPLTDGRGQIRGGVVFLSDVTEVKNAEEKIRQLRLELEWHKARSGIEPQERRAA